MSQTTHYTQRIKYFGRISHKQKHHTIDLVQQDNSGFKVDAPVEPSDKIKSLALLQPDKSCTTRGLKQTPDQVVLAQKDHLNILLQGWLRTTCKIRFTWTVRETSVISLLLSTLFSLVNMLLEVIKMVHLWWKVEETRGSREVGVKLAVKVGVKSNVVANIYDGRMRSSVFIVKAVKVYRTTYEPIEIHVNQFLIIHNLTQINMWIVWAVDASASVSP